MNFARGLRVTRGSATRCCHPNLAEPPVKRQTDRLAATSGCIALLSQVAAASSPRTVTVMVECVDAD